MMRERADLRSLWLAAKIQQGQNRGVGLAGALCWARGWAAGEHGADGLGLKLGFGGLEICRQPCESLRGSRVGGRESLFWWCGAYPGWSGPKLWKAGKPVLELQVVLRFCGGSTEKHCQECRRAGKQCPASRWAGGTGVGSSARALGQAEELGKLCVVASELWLQCLKAGLGMPQAGRRP